MRSAETGLALRNGDFEVVRHHAARSRRDEGNEAVASPIVEIHGFACECQGRE